MSEIDVLSRITDMCKERQWNIPQLAQKCNLPYSVISSLYLKNTTPNIDTLQKICTGLGMSISDFFSEDVNTSEKKTVVEVPKYQQLFAKLDETSQELAVAYMEGLAKMPKNQ